ncbi:MAG: LysR substrate-binding domain-containing protein [Betaproteobacteria bacterium]
MDRFLAVTVFAKVVEQGSFARAADRLSMSTSAVSRHVGDLEAHLDARLLNRTTRRLSLTESGQAFYERSVQLLADLEEAEQAVTAAAVVPRGTLKLTCAVTFGIRHLAPAIAEFAARHPQLRFDVELSDRAVDIVDEGIDLAIRIGGIGSQALIGRRLGAVGLVACAAPTYLARRGTPATPEDLAQHACLTYEYSPAGNLWRFDDAEGREHSVKVAGPAHSNNGRMQTALAVAGVGIAHEPDFIVGPEIRSGRLVRLLPAYRSPASSVYAVYPSRRHLSAKVRAFVDFLVLRYAGRAEWELPPSAPAPAGESRRKSSR